MAITSRGVENGPHAALTSQVASVFAVEGADFLAAYLLDGEPPKSSHTRVVWEVCAEYTEEASD